MWFHQQLQPSHTSAAVMWLITSYPPTSVAHSPHPPGCTGINGILLNHLQVLLLAQERQRETQTHLLAALPTESEPNRKLLSRMLLCINSQVLEIGSGGNMLIITHLLEPVIIKN